MEFIKIETIKPYEKNAKKHAKKQIEQVANSIKEFGFNQPIVVDKENVIIVGHGRYEASKLLGLKEVPVKVVDLTEKQAMAYRLADNKLNESDWDMDLVIEDLKGLSDDLFDLTGFDKDLLIEPDEKDDEVPDVPDEAKSKLGDIYQLGNNRIMCGDSTKIEDVEKLMDGKKADMVFTDPPYLGEMGRGGFSKDLKLQKGKDKKIDDIRSIYNFDPTKTFPIIETFKKEVINIFLFCNKNLVPKYLDFALENKRLFDILTWHKTSFIPANNNTYYPDTEYLIKIKDKGAFFKTGLGKTVNYGKYWVLNNKDIENHPTVKPQEIIKDCLLICSKESDIVMDLFLGSGSTLIACEKTNRTCYGMELDPKYIDVIIKRWEDYSGNKAIKLN